MAAERIDIPVRTWRRLVGQLQTRGRGRRESGAFLLGRADSARARVETFACYDDLDPGALQSGVVMFHARGFSALWKLCGEHGLKVLADVHTHPTANVQQSAVDQENPMLPIKGHVGLILPRFGRTSKWSLSGVGIHVFEGGAQWSSIRSDDPLAPVRLCAW